MNLEVLYENALKQILHERYCGCICMEAAGRALATADVHKQGLNLLTDFYVRALVENNQVEHRKLFKLINGRFGR